MSDPAMVLIRWNSPGMVDRCSSVAQPEAYWKRIPATTVHRAKGESVRTQDFPRQPRF
jgi:hypothetical protein